MSASCLVSWVVKKPQREVMDEDQQCFRSCTSGQDLTPDLVSIAFSLLVFDTILKIEVNLNVFCHVLPPPAVPDCIFFRLVIQFGEGHGTPLQYSCLENPMDGGAWWTAVHAKGQTRLTDFPFTFHFHALEKEMATHSSVLAWRIPGTGEPGGLPSLGSHRVRHD